jgi:hypothetical protein
MLENKNMKSVIVIIVAFVFAIFSIGGLIWFLSGKKSCCFSEGKFS